MYQKLWASWNDQIGAQTSPTKRMLDQWWKAIENLETNTESTNKNHWQKNMVRLVLQNKQNYILKSHKFAVNTTKRKTINNKMMILSKNYELSLHDLQKTIQKLVRNKHRKNISQSQAQRFTLTNRWICIKDQKYHGKL